MREYEKLHSRMMKGWIAALIAAIPIGLLLSQGYRFLYLFAPELGFDLFAAIILFTILPAKKYQHVIALPIVLVITCIFIHFHIIHYFIGGL